MPDAVAGLEELARVVRPSGTVLLLEHVRIDRLARLSRLMDLLDPLAVRLMGPHINRHTVENVQRAGLEVEPVEDLAPRSLVKLIVAACNTASAGAVPRLQREFRIPIVGVIDPGARASIDVSKNERIGVIGTAGTIRSGAYQNRIQTLNPAAKVYARACPLFVPLVEEGRVSGPITQMVADTYLGGFKESDIDTLVLGCTHYPLLRGAISAAVGAGVSLVDSAVETAKDVR